MAHIGENKGGKANDNFDDPPFRGGGTFGSEDRNYGTGATFDSRNLRFYQKKIWGWLPFKYLFEKRNFDEIIIIEIFDDLLGGGEKQFFEFLEK